MAKEKIKFAWNDAELRAVYSFVSNVIWQSNYGDRKLSDCNKLVIVILGRFYKRLQPFIEFSTKTTYKVSMKEALAFKIAGEEYDLTDFDTYSANVLMQVFHKIDRETI
jgi:hypothetical protein